MDSHNHAYVAPWSVQPCFSALEVRQFEFNQHEQCGRFLAAGTTNGCTVIGDHTNGKLLGAVRKSEDKFGDPILAICWLRSRQGYLVAANASGATDMVSAASVISGYSPEADNGYCAGSQYSTQSASGVTRLPDLPVVKTYTAFPNLTAIHLNSDDSLLLNCGYSNDVHLLDVATGRTVREMAGLHGEHINIARFAHESPWLMATCSFDKTAKLWDVREGL